MTVNILKEGVNRDEIDLGQLTSDCMFVTMEDGVVDLVKCTSRVRIFDDYFDRGKKIVSIDFSGGRLNPKLSDPTV